jgi:methionyl-tRNA formyltransferase
MRLIFAGTPEFAARALSALLLAGHDIALVLAQPDRASGRGLRLAPGAVKALSLERGLDVYQPARLNDEETLARLGAVGADAMIVAAYGLILPEPILRITRLGAINIHASLLPRWRGAAPIQRALLAGDERTGISIMQMDRGLDTGPVLASESVAIEEGDDSASLHEKLAGLGAQLVVTVLAQLGRGLVCPQPQAAAGASYAAKIAKAEAEIDWSEAAKVIERKVRAFSPLPGAATMTKGVGLKIWRAAVSTAAGMPGTILEASAKGIVVACGSESLRVLELQRAGGKKLAVAQFLAGFPLAAGERLEFCAKTTI